MPSRWMAPKLAKMRQPYTDQQRMLMDEKHRTPAPEVLDALAEFAMHGGYAGDRHPECETCHQRTSANGTCGCTLYIPAPPRTLDQRRDMRRLQVAVDMRMPRRKPKPRAHSPARERALARMGLR